VAVAYWADDALFFSDAPHWRSGGADASVVAAVVQALAVSGPLALAAVSVEVRVPAFALALGGPLALAASGGGFDARAQALVCGHPSARLRIVDANGAFVAVHAGPLLLRGAQAAVAVREPRERLFLHSNIAREMRLSSHQVTDVVCRSFVNARDI